MPTLVTMVSPTRVPQATDIAFAWAVLVALFSNTSKWIPLGIIIATKVMHKLRSSEIIINTRILDNSKPKSEGLTSHKIITS